MSLPQWNKGKKPKVAHLGEESTMYYNEKVGRPSAGVCLTLLHRFGGPWLKAPVHALTLWHAPHVQLKRWVEPGKEDEIMNDPGAAPPPKALSSPSTSGPASTNGVAARTRCEFASLKKLQWAGERATFPCMQPSGMHDWPNACAWPIVFLVIAQTCGGRCHSREMHALHSCS